MAMRREVEGLEEASMTRSQWRALTRRYCKSKVREGWQSGDEDAPGRGSVLNDRCSRCFVV